MQQTQTNRSHIFTLHVNSSQQSFGRTTILQHYINISIKSKNSGHKENIEINIERLIHDSPNRAAIDFEIGRSR